MLPKIVHFVKYHNTFAIGVSLAFCLTAGVFAGGAKDLLVGDRIETVRGVDNSAILAADLERFDARLRIKTIQEDADYYYVGYDYQTLAIEDYVWRTAIKENNLVVSRKVLDGKDLGLFIAEELGETVDRELFYLKEVRDIEKKRGLSQKIITVQYAGLIGEILSPEEKVFPGYTAVIPASELTARSETLPNLSYPNPNANQNSGLNGSAPETAANAAAIDREIIRQIVLDLLARQKAGETAPTEPAPAPAEPKLAEPGSAEESIAAAQEEIATSSTSQPIPASPDSSLSDSPEISSSTDDSAEDLFSEPEPPPEFLESPESPEPPPESPPEPPAPPAPEPGMEPSPQS